MTTSKFHIICSCVICHTEMTVQSLSSHHKKHTTVPKFTCGCCGKPTNTKFCSRSCAATTNNTTRNATPGPKKGTGAYTPLTSCPICNKLHRYRNTCSKQCKAVLLSRAMKRRIENGFNPNEHRGRSRRSYLEQSFAHWIDTNFPTVS